MEFWHLATWFTSPCWLLQFTYFLPMASPWKTWKLRLNCLQSSTDNFLTYMVWFPGMFLCYFWHNSDGPFYGTYGTLLLMVYIYLPFLAHLCTQYPIETHVPLQPNMAWWIYVSIMAHLWTIFGTFVHSVTYRNTCTPSTKYGMVNLCANIMAHLWTIFGTFVHSFTCRNTCTL